MYDEYKKLIEDGHIVYSFSRLGSFKNCPYEYKLIHIDKKERKDNIYTKLGTLLHDCLEKIYNNEMDISELKIEYINGYNRIKNVLGYKFSSDVIEENWSSCIGHFVDNFKKDKCKCENERHFITKIGDNFLQGYIDKIIYNDDGTIDIHDYKTSSKFTKKDMKEKGNQLLLYALGMEEQGYKINKLYWNMLKYVNVYTKYDDKRTNPLTERNKIWITKKIQLLKACNESGKYTEKEAYDLWVRLSENNSLDVPDNLKDYIRIEEGLLEYPYTEENKEYLTNYVINTIKDIEKEKDFNPIEIKQSTSFYCSNLCTQSNNCQSYKKYVENLPDLQLKTIVGDEQTQTSFRDFFA